MIPRSACVVGRRFLSTTNTNAALFDGEMSSLYERVFAQHYHTDGPWKLMVRESMMKAAPLSMAPLILDLATGPGEPATQLGVALPEATVIASDIAPDMVAKATERIEASGVGNVMPLLCDAQDMHMVPSASQDIVTCCYGFMFCPEPEKAFAEVERVLKPGGTLIACVWVDLAVMRLMREVMTTCLNGEAPPPPPINPMSMAKPGLAEGLIADAGMTLERTTESEYPFDMGTVDLETGKADELAFKLTMLPITTSLNELVDSGENPAAWEIARSVLDEALVKGDVASIDDDGSIITVPNRFKMLVATK